MPKKVLSGRVTNKKSYRAQTQRHKQTYVPMLTKAARSSQDLASIDRMQRILFFFIVGLFACAELGAGILFLVARDAHVFVLLTIPSLAFYHIICYVFPTKRISTQFLQLVQSLFRK
jgi:hypothetical protein